MTIRLYDGKTIGIAENTTLSQISEIIDDIFKEPRYQEYYGHFEYHKPNAEALMRFFDMLGWAMLTKSDHNVKPILARYKALKRKKKRSGVEEIEFLALKEQHVFYEDNDILFFMNTTDECACSKEKAEKIKSIKNKVVECAGKIKQFKTNIKTYKALMVDCPVEQLQEYYSMMTENKSSISFFNQKIRDLISEYNELTGFSYVHVR